MNDKTKKILSIIFKFLGILFLSFASFGLGCSIGAKSCYNALRSDNTSINETYEISSNPLKSFNPNTHTTYEHIFTAEEVRSLVDYPLIVYIDYDTNECVFDIPQLSTSNYWDNFIYQCCNYYNENVVSRGSHAGHKLAFVGCATALSHRIHNTSYNCLAWTFNNDIDHFIFSGAVSHEGISDEHISINLVNDPLFDYIYTNLEDGINQAYQLTFSNNKYFSYANTTTYKNADTSYYIRGEDITLHKDVIFQQLTTNQLVRFDISNLSVSEYDRGFSNGVTAGRVEGLETGYWKGYEEAKQYYENLGTSNNIFVLIGSALSVVWDCLSFEIAPHLTLGLLISIPIAVGVLITVIKMLKE